MWIWLEEAGSLLAAHQHLLHARQACSVQRRIRQARARHAQHDIINVCHQHLQRPAGD